MRRLPGFLDVNSDLQITGPRVLVDIDRDKASAPGASADQIESALDKAYGSPQVRRSTPKVSASAPATGDASADASNPSAPLASATTGPHLQRFIGGDLDGPLRYLPQESVARAEPALEVDHLEPRWHRVDHARFLLEVTDAVSRLDWKCIAGAS